MLQFGREDIRHTIYDEKRDNYGLKLQLTFDFN